MKPPTVAVVICAYTLDRWDDLSAAVASTASQHPAPDELWLVVDHNDELLERARAELASVHRRLQVVHNQRKQGLSGARNTALDHTDADVVAFLDDDAEAEPGWLRLLREPYEDESVIAVGGAAQPRWGDGAARPSTLPSEGPDSWGELDWIVGCSYEGQPRRRQRVRNLMGCNMSFRRDVFLQVGGFSEDLGRVGRTPLGCEETELCIRATAARPGTQILFEPRALVRHHVSEDRFTWHYLRHRSYAEGISKAAVSAMVGADQALQTERGYVVAVLPRAFIRELGVAAHRGSGRRGLAGLCAIGLALGATTVGYARGWLTVRSALRRTGPRGTAEVAAPSSSG
jgi:glycosyltransferase involved in cell wall biosynthesis